MRTPTRSTNGQKNLSIQSERLMKTIFDPHESPVEQKSSKAQSFTKEQLILDPETSKEAKFPVEARPKNGSIFEHEATLEAVDDPVAQVSTRAPLSFAEKAELRNGVFKISEDEANLDGILEIIASDPNQLLRDADDQEVEIDVDQLTTETHHKLLGFLDKSMTNWRSLVAGMALDGDEDASYDAPKDLKVLSDQQYHQNETALPRIPPESPADPATEPTKAQSTPTIFTFEDRS